MVSKQYTKNVEESKTSDITYPSYFGELVVKGTRSPFSNLYSPSSNKSAGGGLVEVHIPMDFIMTLKKVIHFLIQYVLIVF